MFRNLKSRNTSLATVARRVYCPAIPSRNRSVISGRLRICRRVSTEDQELGLQVADLIDAGVAQKDTVKEKASGKEGADRPKYVELLAKLRDGDKLVVWKVDRLGRSTLDALNTAKDLDARGVRIVITTLGVDLKTPAGRLAVWCAGADSGV